MTHELGVTRKEELLGLRDISAYILAGGLGSRMDTLTYDLIPKSLVEIEQGKVLLDYICTDFADQKREEVFSRSEE